MCRATINAPVKANTVNAANLIMTKVIWGRVKALYNNVFRVDLIMLQVKIW